MATQRKANHTTKKLLLTSLVAGLLLVVVNSAVWVNRQVFDAQNFTTTAVTSITSESSRQAIGARITDQALQDNPVLKSAVGDRATNLISGLLATDQAEKILTATVSKLQIYLTSKNQQDVDIDLSGVKTTVGRLVEISGTEPSRVDPDTIPNKIVLVQAKNIPDFYNYGVALSWLAAIGFIVAIVLLVLPYVWDRKNYLSIMTAQGVLVALAGLLSLLIGPLFKPSVLQPIQNANGRVVVGNLYDAFISTFNAQTMILVSAGVLVCLVALTIKLAPQLKKLKR